MQKISFQQKFKEEFPVVAICYDFDKTLSPDDMQADGYIQSVGYDVGEFWKESNGLAQANDMDQNLAYMYKMVKEAEGNLIFNKEKLAEYGSNVKLFPGVVDWFERIRAFGKERGVIVEHYIISSGLKEMIEGTEMAKNGAFEKIYASSFYFDERGLARWPAQVVNYTNKTQFLYRIKKGVLDVNDSSVNDYFLPEDIRVPFSNMIYIGDSDTDVPCMKIVNSQGGHSIGVYNPATDDKTKVYKMMRDERIKYFAPADYSEGEELDCLVKSIINKTAAHEILNEVHYACKRENIDFDNKQDALSKEKNDLILKLKDSHSFSQTHDIVAKMQPFSWNHSQRDTLFRIALQNSQVFYILDDLDIRTFYCGLLDSCKRLSKRAREVKNEIEKRMNEE